MSLALRVRGAGGTALTWGAAYAVVGVALLVPLWAFGALPTFWPGAFVRFVIASAFRWAVGGAAMGLAFSAAVMLGERKRTFASLRLPRFAAWGFVAGAVVPLGMAATYVLTGQSSTAINLRTGLLFGGICAIVGAALAAGTLGAARRAPLTPGESPSSLGIGHLTNVEADVASGVAESSSGELTR